MKKAALVALLASTFSAGAFAADYYVVVPSIGKTTSPAEPSAPPAPTITLTLNGYPLPAALVGRAYAGFDFNTVLQVSGDAAFDNQAVSWTLVGGALPEGLTLGADGVLSGTPSAAGNASFQVRASYKTADGTQAFEILTGEVQVALAGATLPAALQGAAYFHDFKPQLSVSGDPAFNVSQVLWALEGALPAGLVFNADGTVTGVPTAEGSYPFTVRAQYLNQQGEQAYQVLVGEIVVSLAAVTAPSGVVGFPYAGLDLKPLASVTGDAAYAGTGLGWRVASGALPAGLTLADGVIGGTPTAKAAGPATVEVSYKGKTAQRALTFDLAVHLKDFGGYRAWSDGTFAETCLAYLQGKPGYSYQGATGSGVYRINPGGHAANVYCDMDTEGGGWTVVRVAEDQRHDPSVTITQATDASPPVPGQPGTVYLPQPVAVALANTSTTIRISEPGTSKAIWSSHPTVMGNLRAGRIANYTTEVEADPTSQWNFSAPGITQLNNTCASWLVPEHSANGWYPSIYWGCGNVSALHITHDSASWIYTEQNGQLVVSYR